MFNLNDDEALNILRNFAQYTDNTLTLAAEIHVSRYLGRCIDHHSNQLRLIPIASFYRILQYPEMSCDPDKIKSFIDGTVIYNLDFRILYELIPRRKISWKKIIAISILFLVAIRYAYPTLRDLIRKLIDNYRRINILLDLIQKSESIHLQSSLAVRNSIQINVIDYQRTISELRNENMQLILANGILSAYIAHLI